MARRAPFFAVIAGLTLALSSCGATESEPMDARSGGTGGAGGDTSAAGEGGEGEPDFPCPVRRIIETKCQRCHQDPPRNGAPFPLLTWENTRAEYGTRLVYEAMLPAIESDFMPFTQLELDPPVEPLTPDEKSTMLDWLESGAPSVPGPSCPED
jgi:hypothetical protein